MSSDPETLPDFAEFGRVQQHAFAADLIGRHPDNRNTGFLVGEWFVKIRADGLLSLFFEDTLCATVNPATYRQAGDLAESFRQLAETDLEVEPEDDLPGFAGNGRGFQ